jgi:hypothetical protein
MEQTTMQIELDNRELATVLAALRYWNRKVDATRESVPEIDIATDGGRFVPLDTDQVNALCERLNQ